MRLAGRVCWQNQNQASILTQTLDFQSISVPYFSCKAILFRKTGESKCSLYLPTAFYEEFLDFMWRLTFFFPYWPQITKNLGPDFFRSNLDLQIACFRTKSSPFYMSVWHRFFAVTQLSKNICNFPANNLLVF